MNDQVSIFLFAFVNPTYDSAVFKNPLDGDVGFIMADGGWHEVEFNIADQGWVFTNDVESWQI